LVAIGVLKVLGSEYLNREADRLEAAMASLAFPVRVSDGHVKEGRVRYHATPVAGSRRADALELGPRIATALGAESVIIEAAGVGVTIDVAIARPQRVRLLSLLSSLGRRPAMTAVAGVDWKGVPVVLNLLQSSTWHLLAEAEMPLERSAWLRSLVASLALGSRPSDLQLLGVDLTGIELAFIEGLPHALTDVAFRADSAIDLLAWLRDGAERRLDLARSTPHLVIVIDDLGGLVDQTGRVASSLVHRLLAVGRQCGVHVVAGCRPSDGLVLRGKWAGDECAFAKVAPAEHGPMPGAGGLEITANGQVYAVNPPSLPAADIDRVVREAATSPHAAREAAA
jgi:DNA segregation ATPase FtsK/SpoIIIE-like protein